MIAGEKGSPFECAKCTRRDMKVRNCRNHLGLSEDARAVTEFTPAVIAELKDKKAIKVCVLGSDMRLYECPISYLTVDTAEIINLSYLIDDSNALLHPGGWGNQPAWLVEAVGIFKAEEARRSRDK